MTDYWTRKRTLAAQLAADGDLTDIEIAAAVGRSRNWLYEQKAQPAFQARVREIIADARVLLAADGIRKRDTRLTALEDWYYRIQRIVTERAADPAHQGVPGWASGLLTHDVKSVRSGRVYRALAAGVNGIVADDGVGGQVNPADLGDPEYEVHHIYEFDAALVREGRAALQQVAQELGEWTEKLETRTAHNDAYVEMHREMLAAIEEARAAPDDGSARPN